MYVCMYVCMHACMNVCMYYVYMSFPQMRHCNIAPLHQLGICHKNVTVCMYVCMYVYMYLCMYVGMFV